jgi:hypothetical protein
LIDGQLDGHESSIIHQLRALLGITSLLLLLLLM